MNRTISLFVASLALAASAGRPVIKIWAGEENAFFLREDSTVYGIGRNDWSQLGRIHTEGVKSRNSGLNRFGKMFQDPEFPIGPNLYGAVSIVPAPTFTLAVLNDHTVWATGENSWGQHANGIIQPSPAFTQVLEGMDSVAAGDQHALYLGTDGVLKAAGRNHKGQLGLPADGLRRSALSTVSSGVRAVWAVGNTSFFVKTDGSVWAMGENVSGLIPGSTAPVVVTPVRIPGVPSSVVGVRASRKHAVALLADGTVWGWGSDENGALSGVSSARLSGPVQIAEDIQDMSTTSWGTVMVGFSGKVWTFSGGSRSDVSNTSNAGSQVYLYENNISILNELSSVHGSLETFACSDVSCWWQTRLVPIPGNYTLGAGLWATNGTPLSSGPFLGDKPSQRLLGINYNFGNSPLSAAIQWKGSKGLQIPGEVNWAYGIAGTGVEFLSVPEISFPYSREYMNYSPASGGVEAFYVISSLQDIANGSPAQSLQSIAPNRIYLPDPLVNGCRIGDDGRNYCRYPVQAALDVPIGTNLVRRVEIHGDPDGSLPTEIFLTQGAQIHSAVPGVKIILTEVTNGPHEISGVTVASAISSGRLVDLEQVIFMNDTLELPFGNFSGKIFGSVIVSRPELTQPGFVSISNALIADSKFQRWGYESKNGMTPLYLATNITNSRFSNVIFVDGARLTNSASSGTTFEQVVFHKLGISPWANTTSYDLAETFREGSMRDVWASRRPGDRNVVEGWIYSMASVDMHDVTLSGTPKLAATLESRVQASQIVLSGGKSDPSTYEGLFSGSLGIHSEIGISKTVVANHTLGGENLLSGDDPGQVDNLLVYGVSFYGSVGGLFGSQEYRTGVKNSYFLWNVAREMSSVRPLTWSGYFEQNLVDGAMREDGECQINAEMAGWKGNTILASPCRGSTLLNSSSQSIGIFNTLGFGLGGTLRSTNSILSSGQNENLLSSLITSPAGLDGLRETWWDNDYSPKAGGPLVDQGNSSVTLPRSTDLAGYPRVSGAAIDIGAYELTDLATYTLQILPSEGGQTLPAEFAIAMPENGHKVQVVASPFNMWNFERWEFDPLDVSVENPLSPTTMVTLTKNASIKAIFRKTTTFDDVAKKYLDPLLDDWNPSCEFAGAPHWDFQHGTALHFGDKRMQMVLEAAPFRAQLATDGGVRVYLDVLEQPGMNVYDYRFKIRAKRGGGWFVTRERWDVSGLKPKWKFDGDSRVDATVGAIAANTTLQTSLDGPFTKHTYVQAGGLFEIELGLPQSVAKTNVGLWIEGAGDRFVTAATPLSYTWEGPGASFTIDGNLQDWLAPVPGAAP